MGIFSIFNKKDKETVELKIEKNLPNDTSVNLWLKPGTNLIHIYEYGYLSGDGLIGQHENKLLASHLMNGKAFEAKVIANDKISIRLFEKTGDQLLDENYLKNEYPKLKTEF